MSFSSYTPWEDVKTPFETLTTAQDSCSHRAVLELTILCSFGISYRKYVARSLSTLPAEACEIWVKFKEALLFSLVLPR